MVKVMFFDPTSANKSYHAAGIRARPFFPPPPETELNVYRTLRVQWLQKRVMTGEEPGGRFESGLEIDRGL